jgi:hypothetical protein
MMDTTEAQPAITGVQPANAVPPSPAPAAPPASGLEHGTTSARSERPFVADWPFPNGAGSAKLAVHEDGAYLFSGGFKENRPGHDFEIALALRVGGDGNVIFRHVGEASRGVEWSKEGRSDILKVDYKVFAPKPPVLHGEFELPLSSEGRAKIYEEQEKKREALLKEEKEAEQRHDEKMAAEKRAEREKDERERREAAQKAATSRQAAPSQSGGVWSTVAKVAGSVGTALLGLL